MNAQTIAITGQSGIYAIIDCDINLADRDLWAEYKLLCSGCLDASEEVAAGSVITTELTPTVSWPACSTVSR